MQDIRYDKNQVIRYQSDFSFDFNQVNQVGKRLLKMITKLSKIYNIHSYRSIWNKSKIKYGFTKCMVLHPVTYPNKGPRVEQYLAEQAIGLASSLNWQVIKGPFWNRKSQKMMTPMQIAKKDMTGIWIQSDANQIKDGTYVRTSIGNGIYYKGGIIFQGDQSQSDGDLNVEWRDKLLRGSIANSSLVKVKRITQKAFFTKGKLEIISQYLESKPQVDCVFINTELKPGQIRNIRKILQAKVNGLQSPKGYTTTGDQNSQTQIESQDADLNQQERVKKLMEQGSYDGGQGRKGLRQIRIFDRFSIILQIFAKRATSKLTKLQIQLSYLNYIKTRLVRQGSTYSTSLNIFAADLMKYEEKNLQIVSAKQRRAIGMMSGEGENQLELERRNVRQKLANVKRQIELQGELRRKNLQKAKTRSQKGKNHPIIAIIGYTNVGKSALMNAILKKQEVQSKDLLFQTLRTTQRQIELPSGQKAVLLDTIGFITNLPHQLFSSFKATLEQINNADLIIHLKDVSHPQLKIQNEAITSIIKDMESTSGNNWVQTGRVIEVWNKVDLIKQNPNLLISAQAEAIENDLAVKISATKGTGIQALLKKVEETLFKLTDTKTYKLRFHTERHFKIMTWMEQNINIPFQQNIPTQYNYDSSKQYPTGWVQIVLNLDKNAFGKLKKFLLGQLHEARFKNKTQKIIKSCQVVISVDNEQFYTLNEQSIAQMKETKKNKGMPPKGW